MPSKKAQNFGFVRVGAGVPKGKVCDTIYNAEQIVRVMEMAEARGVKVLGETELATTMYSSEDYLFTDTLREANYEALQVVVTATKRSGASKAKFTGLVFVGCYVEFDDMLFNCSAAIKGGRILGLVPKEYLPNYKEFREKRWFSAGSMTARTSITLLGQEVPFGTDLLFEAEDVEGLVVATTTCEDDWAPIPGCAFPCLAGATVVVNLSASPEQVGKVDYRKPMLMMRSADFMCAHIYASSGIGESSTDLVFAGATYIYENGNLLKEGERFAKDNLLITADIDLQVLRNDRLRNGTFAHAKAKFKQFLNFRRIKFTMGEVAAPKKLERRVDGLPFVPKDPRTLAERCYTIFNIQMCGLTKRLETVHPNAPVFNVAKGHYEPDGVIGISGGSDSTAAAIIAAKYCDMRGRPRSVIHGYTMPGFGTTKRTKGNAIGLMEEFGFTMFEVDIRPRCLQMWRDIKHKPFGVIDIEALFADSETRVAAWQERRETREAGAVLSAEDQLLDGLESNDELKNQTMVVQLVIHEFTELLKKLPAGAKDLVFENVQARARTETLMNAGFVLGTGDLSELFKGWCTFNADHMSMYNVNASVPKTLIMHLIRWAAKNEFDGRAREILIDIANTPISPELLPTTADGKVQQKTTDSIGPFPLTDYYGYLFIRYGFTPEKMLYLASQAEFRDPNTDEELKFTEEELRKWLKDFIWRFVTQQYKRSTLPDAPKVGSISVSPRNDLRLPSDASPRIYLEWAGPQPAGTNSTSNGVGGVSSTTAPATGAKS